jgi:hypothetical protein
MEANMPTDLTFWIVLIAVVFVLGALAIWKWGKNVNFSAGPVSLQTSDRAATDPVTVAKKAAVDGSVGEVIGRTGVDPAAPHGPTEVAEEMKIGQGGRVDRIVGVEVGQPKQPKP